MEGKIMKLLTRVLAFLFIFSVSAQAQQVSDLVGYAIWNGPRVLLPTTATMSADYRCGEPREYPEIQFYRNYLIDVVAWLTDENDGALFKDEYTEEDRKIKIVESECEFKPRHSIVAKGGRINLLNNDVSAHWVMVTIGSTQLFQKTHSNQNDSFELMADSTGVISLQSAMHHWMRGYVKVVDSDYNAIVGRGGQFVIHDVPDGSYRLHVWHPYFGEITKEISLPRFSRVEMIYPTAIPDPLQ